LKRKTSKPKIVLVLPAYNAASRLPDFLKKIPRRLFSSIILVDDRSTDNTYELAQEYPFLSVYQTRKNLGYGGNMKQCIMIALKKRARVIVELHPDDEYGTDAIRPAIEKIEGGAGLVLGNRFANRSNPMRSGMFLWKYPFLKLLNGMNNMVLGTRIPDLHQGFRVYGRRFLETARFERNSNDYLFSFEIILQALHHRFKIRSVPVSTHYRGKKRGASLLNCIRYTLQTFQSVLKYLVANMGMYSKQFPKP